MIKEQHYNMVKILSEREEFLVIGLTGRVGSGCSEAADILCSTISDLQMPSIYPGDRGLQNDDERDKRIIVRYFNAHWLAFDLIQVRTIITSFLLSDMSGFCEELLKIERNSAPGDQKEDGENATVKKLGELKAGIEKLLDSKIKSILPKCFDDVKKFIYNNIIEENSIGNDVAKKHIKTLEHLIKQLEEQNKKIKEIANYEENEIIYENAQMIDEKAASDYSKLGSMKDEIEELFRYLYKDVLLIIIEKNKYEEKRKYCEMINKALYAVSAIIADKWFHIQKSGDIWTQLADIDIKLSNKRQQDLDFYSFVFVHDIMPAMSSVIHKHLTDIGSANFTGLYQKYGNCIRKFGEIIFDQNKLKEKLNGEQNNDIFAIPRKINRFIKVLRRPFSREFSRPTRVVIDSIKNSFEATYLRDRYSAFYLFAISADESTRIKRLMESSQKSLNLEQIHYIDWNEYSTVGQELYSSYKDDKGVLTKEEKEFCKWIEKEDDIRSDLVRKQAYKDKTHPFFLQDVKSCIENADVFISNKGVGNRANMPLKWELVRYICLIIYPGLVQPTPIERCMQIAFTAKANSGCLSRQVGAVVTDKSHNILSIGWNDVPCGDISCARKNLKDLCKLEDIKAYTHYELENVTFRNRLPDKKLDGSQIGKLLCGLPLRYCFKDIHTEAKNPMRSRSMHGEEKALENCGKECEGGNLFTTASPCEMCSKKAKDHKIKKIYYIEPYPGISEDQYSNSGDPENIAIHILFTGAIGRAYTQMYTPLMPHKDILEYLGVKEYLEI